MSGTMQTLVLVDNISSKLTDFVKNTFYKPVKEPGHFLRIQVFKLRGGASRTSHVGRSVGPSVPGKF